MYGSNKKRLSIEDLADIIIVKPIPQSMICSQQPLRVQHNCSFVVDLTELNNPLDIRADDNSVWNCKGSPSTFISIHDGVVKRRSRLHQHPNHYKITRYYYNHSSSPDFHRIIIMAYGMLIEFMLYTVF